MARAFAFASKWSLRLNALEGHNSKTFVGNTFRCNGDEEILIIVICWYSIWLMRNRKVFEGFLKFEESRVRWNI